LIVVVAMKADDDNDLSKEATTLLRAPNTNDERNWNERKLNNDDANTVVCFRDDGNIGHWIGLLFAMVECIQLQRGDDDVNLIFWRATKSRE